MPEQLTASKKVYQQEFSMKPKERQKYFSKTLIIKNQKTEGEKMRLSHSHNNYKKTGLQTNVISKYTEIPTYEKSKPWFIPPP